MSLYAWLMSRLRTSMEYDEEMGKGLHREACLSVAESCTRRDFSASLYPCKTDRPFKFSEGVPKFLMKWMMRPLRRLDFPGRSRFSTRRIYPTRQQPLQLVFEGREAVGM